MDKGFLYICIIAFLLFSCNDKKLKVSNASQDSINYYIEKANDFTIDAKIRRKQIDKASKIIYENANDSINLANQLKLALTYANLDAKIESKETLLNVEKNSIKEKDSINLARAYVYLGDYYSNYLLSDSSYNYYYQAEKIFLKLKDNMRIGYMHVKKAEAQYNERDYIGAEKSAITALFYLRLNRNADFEFKAYNLLGSTSLEIKEYDKAFDYFQKSLEIANENDIVMDFQPKAIVLFNLAQVSFKQTKYNQSIEFCEFALKEKNLIIDSKILYASILDLKALSSLKNQNFNNLPDDFYNSLSIRKTNNNTIGEIISQIHLSEYYETINNKDSAIHYAQLAYENANKTRILNLRLDAVDQLTKVIDVDIKKYSEISKNLRDSLVDAERKVSEKFARIEFETEEIKQEKEKLAIQNRNIIYIALLAILILVLLFVLRMQKNKNQRLLLVQQQQIANEEIYTLMLSQQQKLDQGVFNEKKRISQELHDGILGRLFGARLNLDSLNNSSEEDAFINRKNYIEELKNLEQDIREISHDLNREKSAITNNFTAIVNNLVEEQKKLNKANLNFYIDSSIVWDHIPNDIKINLYRIIQETFQNINKYAQAKNISFEIKNENKSLKVHIDDDGEGFDVSKKSKGIGIQNIKSRVEACHGVFSIQSSKEKGTNVFVQIPI